MRAYVYTHEGIWLAAFTVIVAPDRETADREMQARLKPGEWHKLEGEFSVTEVGAHQVWDGDY